MKAAVCREFGRPLVIEQVDLAEPSDGELVVELRACAICHSDISFATGAWGGELPAVYGHEASGVVSAVGPGVAGVAVGDRVVVTLIRSCGGCYFCSRGQQVLCDAEFRLDREPALRDAGGAPIAQGMRTAAFAERVLVHASQVAVVGDEIAFDVAATLGCGVLTGVGAAVNTARLRPGESAVVVGAGGVGLNAIQGASLCGAHPVIAVDVSDAKLAAAREFGATHTVNPAAADPAAIVAGLTGGRMADCVLVAVGSAGAIQRAAGLMRRGGTTVVVGMPPSGETVSFDPGALAGDGQTVVGSKMGSSRVAVDIPALVAQYRAGRLSLERLVSERRPLEQVNEAIAGVLAGEVLRSVIVF
ncbi:MAG TPA: zinc-binding dehydrogenase [Gaiellales bacterium]|nr:zinc-binding dehydrogenase [Gaiellales bacterium]